MSSRAIYKIKFVAACAMLANATACSPQFRFPTTITTSSVSANEISNEDESPSQDAPIVEVPQELENGTYQLGKNDAYSFEFSSSGGEITECEINPATPSGLTFQLDEGKCVLSGSPTELQNASTYTLSISNGFGSDEFEVDFSVVPGSCDANAEPFGNGDGSTEDPYQICSVEQLMIAGELISDTPLWQGADAPNYILKTNLDLNGQSNLGGWGSVNAGFGLNGVFDGNNHTISNWSRTFTTTNENSTEARGFFNIIADNAVVKNLHFENAQIILDGDFDRYYFGGIAGLAHQSTLENNSISITVASSNNGGALKIGGLVGNLDQSSLIRCFAETNIQGAIRGTFAQTTGVGGLAGYATAATIEYSGATGIIVGNHATGTFRAYGGLLGYGENSISISNSYANTSITNQNATALTHMGGLVGRLQNLAVLSHTFSASSLTGPATQKGGLIGQIGTNTSTANYWHLTLSGVATSAAGTGLSTEEALDSDSFSGWDFEDTWIMGDDYPILID